MSEVTFTASSYLHMRHLLTPKHLELAPAKRKQQLRDKYLLQPPAVAIRESKLQFLRPLAEIETIMRHFDAYSLENEASSTTPPSRVPPGSATAPAVPWSPCSTPATRR
jgi:hypothetical protein